jgi:hypothetical protein
LPRPSGRVKFTFSLLQFTLPKLKLTAWLFRSGYRRYIFGHIINQSNIKHIHTMKTIINFVKTTAFASLFSLISISAFAQEVAMNKPANNTIAESEVIVPRPAYYRSFQAVVFPRLNGTVSVNIEKAPHENIMVRVYNHRGQVVHEKKMGKKELVTRNYQLNNLPKGSYTFEVASQSKVYRKEVTLN